MRIMRSIRRWLADVTEPAEDPRVAFRTSAGDPGQVLDRVRAAHTSIATSREQAEAKVREARARLNSMAEDGAEDIVAQQLRTVVEEDLRALDEEIASLRADEEQLASAERRVSAQANAIAARQEAVRAVREAARARARVHQELGGLSSEIGQLGDVLEQMERRTHDVEAMASALDRLDALGIFAGGWTFADPEAQRLAARYAAASRERGSDTRRQVGNGFKALVYLEAEYRRLEEVLMGRRETDPLSVSYVPSLAEGTYKQGLSVLKDAFELVLAIRSPSEDELRASIAELEAEQSRTGGTTDLRRRIAAESLESARQRLKVIGRNRGHVDELLHLGGQCAAALTNARLELAAIQASGAGTSVEAATASLRAALDQAREVRDELKELGL